MTDFTNKLFNNLSMRPKIVFPEGDNPIIIKATSQTREFVESILLTGKDSMVKATKMVADGKADSMIAGIDYTSRDVILACRDNIGMRSRTFSASFVMDLPDERVFTLADCAACKNPTAEQLVDIVLQTVDETHSKISNEPPRVAMLSFSTLGSGGKDPSIEKMHDAISIIKKQRPELSIEGEMQLDAAINPSIGAKKSPGSKVAGKANILICPDLNSGNILYKSMEQFGGAHAYGPILQGFRAPISDLSRGSTTEDVLGVIAITVARL